MSNSVPPHRRQPTRLPRPWDSPGKNIGMGCHFLLQCIKVKSESEVAQLCLTPSDPMDCSLPGSPVHGIFQARVLEWGAIAFSRGSQLRDGTLLSCISCTGSQILCHCATWEALFTTIKKENKTKCIPNLTPFTFPRKFLFLQSCQQLPGASDIVPQSLYNLLSFLIFNFVTCGISVP